MVMSEFGPSRRSRSCNCLVAMGHGGHRDALEPEGSVATDPVRNGPPRPLLELTPKGVGYRLSPTTALPRRDRSRSRLYTGSAIWPTVSFGGMFSTNWQRLRVHIIQSEMNVTSQRHGAQAMEHNGKDATFSWDLLATFCTCLAMHYCHRDVLLRELAE